MKIIKIISIALIVMLIANIILFALGAVNVVQFWFVIILAGISSLVIKKMPKK
jgi:hypothetical protein